MSCVFTDCLPLMGTVGIATDALDQLFMIGLGVNTAHLCLHALSMFIKPPPRNLRLESREKWRLRDAHPVVYNTAYD